MRRKILSTVALLLALTLTVFLGSCDKILGTGSGDNQICEHRDADDNSLCDKCGEAYTDGKDVEDEPTCEHRDADDNSLCDECGAEYTDGKDVEDEPTCEHRDADDNSLCDKCGEAYTDGKDVEDEPTCEHRDADDNSLCDKCGEAYTDGKDIEDEPTCEHRDADDNSLCDKCGVEYTDGKDVEDEPICQHRDADDNSLCDKCGEAYTDGKDVEDEPTCQHRDADDNSLCDKCGEAYTDGKDVEDEPTCQHRDADDDFYCDNCGEEYNDGEDEYVCEHRDADDDFYCDNCGEEYDDGEDEYICQHRDSDDDLLCDECGVRFFDGVNLPPEDCEHDFNDWSDYTSPTCITEGQRIRSCRICYLIEYESIEVISHSFDKIDQTVDAEGDSYVTLRCSICDLAAGNTYKGYYKESSGMRILDCECDFSFDVYCEYGSEYIAERLIIVDIFWLESAIYDHPEKRESFEITDLGDKIYRNTHTQGYDENSTYTVILSDDVFFTDILGSTLVFSTDGEEVYNVTMNSDILFLKAIAESRGLEFTYECELVETDEYGEVYVLAIPKAYALDRSYLDRLICIGDCASFDELEYLTSDEAIIGKIAYMEAAGDTLYVLLTIPSIDEIYTDLEIHGGTIPNIDESAIDEESRRLMVDSVMQSEDFIAAIASANVAAMNFARANGYSAELEFAEFKADDFDIKIEAKTDPRGATITVTITYEHSVPIKEGDIPLGHITFKITFVNEYSIDLDVNSNLDKIFTDEVKKNGLKLDCTVVNTVHSTFDITVDLNISYSTDEEASFVINLESKKIHRPTCRHLPGVLGEKYITVRYSDILLYVDGIEKNECKVCQPFSLSDAAFAIHNDSGMIHCINCMHVTNGHITNFYVVKAYPIGYTGGNCSACRPENHIKSLDDYLDESVEDGAYYEMFDTLREMIGDRTTTGQASSIDNDTKPRINITLYCFEIPIFLEPQVHFDLQADFQLHYELTVKNTIFIALVYGDDGYNLIGTCDVTVPKDDITVDITGSIRAEIGVLAEVRLGVRFIARHVYVGISGEAGIYVDVKGVYHLDSAASEQYYAARFEIGYYTEVRCTYKIIGILRADSFPIRDKEFVPIFNSGDDRIYNRFDSYEDSMTVSNTRHYYLDNNLLKVTYYDLLDLESKVGYMNWGEKKQYGFNCVFRDADGNVVDYITFKDGAIIISDDAPESFTVYMEVEVYDKIVPETIFDYIGKNNKGGCAIFLDTKVIEINYSYVDTSAEMDRWLGIYEGYYDVGTDILGDTMYYRYAIMGLHRVSDLYEDAQTLEFYARLATYVVLDENGNPTEIYTVERLRELLLGIKQEYVFINYNKPGNSPFDGISSMSATGAYFDNGVRINASNDYYIESEESGYVSLRVENYAEGEGFGGSVYTDYGDYIGSFELHLTVLFE